MTKGGQDKLATKQDKPGESRIYQAQNKDKLVPKYDKFRGPMAFSYKKGRTNHLSKKNKQDKESLS